jgi:hypothetical protein
MIEKPPFRSPCNHCGKCCELEVCDAGVAAFKTTHAPCPGIIQKEDKKLCGLVLIEQALGIPPRIAHGLGIGVGCSMPDEFTIDVEIAVFDALSVIKTNELHPIPR